MINDFRNAQESYYVYHHEYGDFWELAGDGKSYFSIPYYATLFREGGEAELEIQFGYRHLANGGLSNGYARFVLKRDANRKAYRLHVRVSGDYHVTYNEAGRFWKKYE